jgi:hypothetical protein
MLKQVQSDQSITVGGDKGADTAEFVAECRYMMMTPRVGRNTGRRPGSATDGSTTRHLGLYASQRKRKRSDECFG